jgi:hypothetical protein
MSVISFEGRSFRIYAPSTLTSRFGHKDPAMKHRFFLLFLGLLSGPLSAAGGGKGHPNASTPAPFADRVNRPLSLVELKGSPARIFQRVVQARLYHLGNWTLEDPSQTPVTVGRTIASLRPSFVTGILRVADHGVPGNSESEAYTAIRSAVRTSVKGCRFDVVVGAGNETSGPLFVRRMKEIDSRIHPDAWTLFVSPDDTTINADALSEAIAYAHEQGDLVGYDGPLSLVPEGVDYIVVRAWGLRITHPQLDRFSARHLPLIVELPTTFGGKEHPDCTRYSREMDGCDRASLLSRLALNQETWGYRFAYPIFYPVKSSRKAFDATKDSIVMVTIRSLLARFN